MDLRQLEYFVAVAQEGGFTRAAARVGISQSGVSAQIRALEAELGAELFHRTSRTVTLTPAGRAALEPARAAVGAAQAVRQAVDAVRGLVRGELVLGMVAGCTLDPFFDAVADFHRAHPGVSLTLREGPSDTLLDAVRRDAVDLALVGLAGPPPDDLHAWTVVSEPLVALLPAGHPLAGEPHLDVAVLAAHPLVTLPAGSGIRATLEQVCAAHGLTPMVRLEASAPNAVTDLVARGLGLGVLSASMADEQQGRVVRRPLAGAEIPATLAVLWRAATPATGAMLTCLQAAFA